MTVNKRVSRITITPISFFMLLQLGRYKVYNGDHYAQFSAGPGLPGIRLVI